MMKGKPEFAAAAAPAELARLKSSALAGLDCLYVGDEFCQAKLPSAAELKRLRTVFPGRLVVVSSFLTDAWLARFKKLALALAGREEYGFVVNDLGALSWLRGLRGFRPAVSLGRVLVHDLGEFIRSSRFRLLFGGMALSAEIDSAFDLAVCSAAPGLGLNLQVPMKFSAFSRNCYVTGRLNSKTCLACKGAKYEKLPPGPVRERLYLRANALFTGNAAEFPAPRVAAMAASKLPVGRVVFNGEFSGAAAFFRGLGAALKGRRS